MRLSKVLWMVVVLALATSLMCGAWMEEIETPVDEVVTQLGETASEAPEEETSESMDAEDMYVVMPLPDYVYYAMDIYAYGDSYDSFYKTAYVGDKLDLAVECGCWYNNPTVTWMVNKPKIADFSNSKSLGKIKKKASQSPVLYLNKPGKVVIQATCMGRTSSLILEVVEPTNARYVGFKNVNSVEYMELYTWIPSIRRIGRISYVLTTQLYDAFGDKVKDDNVSRSLIWTSSNPYVATVSRRSKPGQANLYLWSTGTTTITARVRNGGYASFTLHVQDTLTPSEIYFVDECGDKTRTLRMEVGERFWLGNIIDGDSCGVLTADLFSYKSHHPSIATVDDNGVVTALRRGHVKIDVKSFNGKKATITVKIR